MNNTEKILNWKLENRGERFLLSTLLDILGVADLSGAELFGTTRELA